MITTTIDTVAAFWDKNSIQDIILLLLVFSLSFPAVLSVRFDRFWRFSAEVLLYGYSDPFFRLLNRLVPPLSFWLWGRLHQALLLTVNIYFLIDRFWSSIAETFGERVVLLTGIFGVLILLQLFTELFQRLIQYVFLPIQQSAELRKYHSISVWWWCMPLYISAFLFFVGDRGWLPIVLLVASFFVWRLWLIVHLFRALGKDRSLIVHLFLYLCAHELAPPVFFLGLIWRSYSNM